MIVQCYSEFQSKYLQKRDPASPLVPEENMEKTSQHGSAPWCWWSFWTSEYSAGPRPRHPNRKKCGKTVFDCCIYCIFLFFGTDLDSLTCFNTHVGSPGIGRWAVSNPAPVGWCWSNWAPGARWRGSWPWCVAPSTAASGTGQGRQDGYGHGPRELGYQIHELDNHL